MAKKTYPKGISIGPDQEIELLEIDYNSSSVLELDEFHGSYSNDVLRNYASAKDPLGRFWNKTETACVVACCGIDAFGIWPEEIVEAIKDLDIRALVDQLESIKEKVWSSDAQIIGYHRLNYNFAKESFLGLLDYLIIEIKRWI